MYDSGLDFQILGISMGWSAFHPTSHRSLDLKGDALWPRCLQGLEE